MNSRRIRRLSHRAAPLTVALAALAAVVAAPSAYAEGDGVSLDAFRPAELATDGFAVARPLTLAAHAYGARLTLDYGFRPLSFDANAPIPDYDVVRHQLMGNASIAFAVHERFTVVVGVPLNMAMRGQTPTALGFPATDGTLSGDPFIVGRARLFGEDGDFFVLGAQLKVTFPLASATAAAELWSGDETPTVQPTVLGELNLSRDIRVNLSLGGRFRGVARQPYLTVGQELTFGAAFTYQIFRDFLDVTGEVYGSTDLGLLAGHHNSAVEIIAGLRAHPTEQWHLGLAFGTAASGGYGASDFRSVLTVGFAQVPEVAYDDFDDEMLELDDAMLDEEAPFEDDASAGEAETGAPEEPATDEPTTEDATEGGDAPVGDTPMVEPDAPTAERLDE